MGPAMPILDNPRHERFARELATGKSATAAYLLAGYRGDRTAAARLSTNVHIKTRIAEMQEKAVERTLVTVESIAAELDEARDLALSDKSYNPSAAVAASMGKAKLYGLLVDQTVSTNTHHVVSPELPTDAEWEAEHAPLN